MNTNERVLSKLYVLAREGFLRKSDCSRSLTTFLHPLIEAGVVCEERARNGRCLRVKNATSLQAFIRKVFPHPESFSSLPRRVAGVHRFRDSKAFPSDNPEIVHVRAWSAEALHKRGNALRADLVTQKHGIFSFRMDPVYTLRGPCALVENPVVFSFFERLDIRVGIVIYGQGRVSQRLLAWLSAECQGDFSLLHLPDYDPIGLNEFERLQRSLGTRVSLHLPRNLSDLFSRYSNPKLLDKVRSRRFLASLRQSQSPEIRTVVQLIDLHNAGLEQEALLPAPEFV